MKRKTLTYEQARSYIMGEEPYDAVEREREHILMLRDSVESAILETAPCHFENLKRTCAKYIENHKSTPNKSELQALKDAYEKVCQLCEAYQEKPDLMMEQFAKTPIGKRVMKHKKASFSR